MFGFFKRKAPKKSLDDKIADILDDAQVADSDLYFMRIVAIATADVSEIYMDMMRRKIPSEAEIMKMPAHKMTPTYVAEVEEAGKKLEYHMKRFVKFTDSCNLSELSSELVFLLIAHLQDQGHDDIALELEKDFAGSCERFKKGNQSRKAILKANGIRD